MNQTTHFLPVNFTWIKKCEIWPLRGECVPGVEYPGERDWGRMCGRGETVRTPKHDTSQRCLQFVRCIPLYSRPTCSATCVDISFIRKQTAPVSRSEIIEGYFVTHERPLATGKCKQTHGTDRYTSQCQSQTSQHDNSSSWSACPLNIGYLCWNTSFFVVDYLS